MILRLIAAAACLPEGDWLGDMKRELPLRRIIELCCAGAKNYFILHLCALLGGDEQVCQKVRGVQLTHEAQQRLTVHRMRRSVQRQFGGDGRRR
jgi:hypothetical protein